MLEAKPGFSPIELAGDDSGLKDGSVSEFEAVFDDVVYESPETRVAIGRMPVDPGDSLDATVEPGAWQRQRLNEITLGVVAKVLDYFRIRHQWHILPRDQDISVVALSVCLSQQVQDRQSALERTPVGPARAHCCDAGGPRKVPQSDVSGSVKVQVNVEVR